METCCRLTQGAASPIQKNVCPGQRKQPEGPSYIRLLVSVQRVGGKKTLDPKPDPLLIID